MAKTYPVDPVGLGHIPSGVLTAASTAVKIDSFNNIKLVNLGDVMAKALLIAFASPTSSEADAEFNAWYDEIHAHEVSAEVGCVTAVTRYRQAGEVGGRPRYIAVYELETDDVGSVAESFNAAAGARPFTATDTIDMERTPPVVIWATAVETTGASLP